MKRLTLLFLLVLSFNVFGQDDDTIHIFQQNEKFGLRNIKTNEIVIAPKYDRFFMGARVRNILLFEIDGKYGAMDWKGNILIQPLYEGCDNGTLRDTSNFFAFGRTYNRGWILFDKKTAKRISSKEYDVIYPLHMGFCGVIKNDKWGFVDMNGKEILPCEYEETSDFFSNGYAHVKKRFWGIINNKGKVVVPCKYESIGSPVNKDGLIKAKLNGKYGYVNLKGKVVIPCKYYSASLFKDGWAEVKEKWTDTPFYIDTKGRKKK